MPQVRTLASDVQIMRFLGFDEALDRAWFEALWRNFSKEEQEIVGRLAKEAQGLSSQSRLACFPQPDKPNSDHALAGSTALL